MTTALILLAAVLLAAWAVSLWRTLSSGGNSPGSAPRHVESDWSVDHLPSQPYRRVPRLP